MFRLMMLKKVKVLVTQWVCLCDPMGCSPPDSSVHGIFQARLLEEVAIPFSWGSRDQTRVSCTGDRLNFLGPAVFYSNVQDPPN